jgi:AhpC/TSA family
MTTYRGAPMMCFGLAVAALAAGCSSGGSAPGGASPTSTGATSGDASGGATVGPLGANPEGIAYPSPASGFGRSPRSGTTPGSVIANFKFSGYPNGVIAPQLQTIALADYFDPCGLRYKVIHLTVAARWCTPCNEETDAIEAAKAQLDAEGVVVVQALEDGTEEGHGATQVDLNDWITQHHTTFTEMLDPDPNPQLGVFFTQASIPWNGDIDPRTMEILDSSPGWSGDVMTEVGPALDAVQSAPNYPLPAACNDQ